MTLPGMKPMLPLPVGGIVQLMFACCSAHAAVVPPRGRALIKTDLSIIIPNGTYARIGACTSTSQFDRDNVTHSDKQFLPFRSPSFWTGAKVWH